MASPSHIPGKLMLAFFLMLFMLYGGLQVAQWVYYLREPSKEGFQGSPGPAPSSSPEAQPPKTAPPPPPPPVRFLDKKETYRLISEDTDRYIADIPPDVAEQRGIPDLDEYRERSAMTAVSFTDFEKGLITRVAGHVDRLLGPDDKDIPWAFAVTEGKLYEDGQPHVRQGVMFLSTDLLDDFYLSTCQMQKTILYLRLQMCCKTKPPMQGPKACFRPYRGTYVDAGHVSPNVLIPSCEIMAGWLAQDE